jgi:uncharacterized membrane protein YgdD (TMEM256/DUF423 family)
MFRKFFVWGAWNALLSVVLGAFGAHALENWISEEMLAVYTTGTHYHFMHAIGLLALSFAADKLPSSRALLWSGRMLLTGIVIFSGSLYVLSLSGETWLGAITPIGGVCFIVGWALAATGVLSWKAMDNNP